MVCNWLTPMGLQAWPWAAYLQLCGRSIQARVSPIFFLFFFEVTRLVIVAVSISGPKAISLLCAVTLCAESARGEPVRSD